MARTFTQTTRNFIVGFAIALSFQPLLAQEKVGEFEIPVNKSVTPNYDPRTNSLDGNFRQVALTNADEANRQLAFFLVSEEVIQSINLNESFEVNNALETFRPLDRSFKNLLAVFAKDGRQAALFANLDEQRLKMFVFDHNQQIIQEFDYQLKLKKKTAIGSFRQDGNFYFFAVHRYSSKLDIHRFSISGEYEMNTVDLAANGYPENLSHAKNLFIRWLYNPLKGDKVIEEPAQKISYQTINNLVTSVDINKFYVNNNRLYLTFDDLDDRTGVATIDLDNYQVNYQDVLHPESQCQGKVSSNSFLYDDKLFQMAICPEELHFSIANLSGERLQAFRVPHGQPIVFMNSSVFKVKQNKISGGEGILDTEMFLKPAANAANSFPGLVVNPTKQGLYEVTIGAYEAYKQDAAVPGIPNQKIEVPYGAKSFMSPDDIFPTEPAYAVFNTFRGTVSRQTYFKSLIDQTTNEHVEGEVVTPVYESIDKYKTEQKLKAFTETVFLFQGAFHYGYYDDRARKYVVVKF